MALCRAVAWGYFASLRLEVLALTRHPEDWSIRARWRLTGLPLHLCLLRFYRRDKRHLLRSAPSQHPFVTPPPPGSFSSHWSGSLDHPVCCPCQSVTLLLSPLSPCPCHPTARQPFLTTDLCPLCRCVPVTPCPHIPVPPQGGMPAHVPVTPGEGECQPRVPMSPMSLHPCHPPQGGIPAPCLLCPLCPYRSPGWDASPVSPTSHISATLWSGGIQAPRPCVPVALPLPREECQPCVPRVPTSLSFPRVGCQPRVPCFPHVLTPAPDSVPQPPRSYDAFSTFFLNSQGLIRCHRVDKVRPGGHRGTLQCPSCPPPAPNFVPPPADASPHGCDRGQEAAGGSGSGGGTGRARTGLTPRPETLCHLGGHLSPQIPVPFPPLT